MPQRSRRAQIVDHGPGAAEGLRRRGRDPGPALAAAQATTSVVVALVVVIVLVVAVTGLVVLVIAPGAAGPVGDTGARADVLAVDEDVVDDGQPDAVRILGRRHLGALVIENGDADDLAARRNRWKLLRGLESDTAPLGRILRRGRRGGVGAPADEVKGVRPRGRLRHHVEARRA